MTKAIEEHGGELVLVAIGGEQLSAVTFVQDYVQLHFDGPTITAITRPSVSEGPSTSEFGSQGYRDRLCGLIGKRVTRAYVRLGDRLQVDFGEQVSLVVSLRPDAYRAAEAAVFSDGKTEQWASW